MRVEFWLENGKDLTTRKSCFLGWALRAGGSIPCAVSGFFF
jgi:hypothetical protein